MEKHFTAKIIQYVVEMAIANKTKVRVQWSRGSLCPLDWGIKCEYKFSL